MVSTARALPPNRSIRRPPASALVCVWGCSARRPGWPRQGDCVTCFARFARFVRLAVDPAGVAVRKVPMRQAFATH